MAASLPSCTDAYALAEAIAQRCEGAHPYQDSWRARCPNHTEQSATSLSITPADDRVLLKCFGTCAPTDVVTALGLTMADLFVWRAPPSNGQRRIVKLYDYVEANGHLAYQTARYVPKDFRQRRPDPAHPGQWIWNLQGIEPVLYRLPEVLDAVQRGETVYLVEGEKDADTLAERGLVATTCPMGAGKWRDSYTERLRGAQVVLLPDNDEPGRKHAHQVARALAGVAASLKVVHLPGLGPKGDVSDWLATGNTWEQLQALTEDAPRWEPEREAPGEARHQVDTSCISLASAVLSFQELMRIDIPERTRYIDWLPERGLVMVYGPRGAGKTMFMLGMAIGLMTGTSFLKWPIRQPMGVLYIDGEMPLVELRERAVSLAQYAIPQGLHFLTGEMVYAKLKRDLVLTTEEFRQAVDHILDEHPAIHMIILDNISCLFSGISEDKKQDWEPINAWLVRLRHRGMTAMLGHHAGKGGQQRGTSGREDSLDTVIAIDYPQNHRAEDGCHFHLRFTKSRSVKGDAVTALDVRLEEVPEKGLTWTVSTLDESRKERIRQMLDDGMSVSEIVKELEVSASYVHRIKREVSGQ
jgi:KaiC/GvpD/RAD55 family RecA-like ATPase